MISSHSVSYAQWNGKAPDPWPNAEYQTVAENGCENCHRPHSAGKHERLLKHAFEEDNCLVCHNGNVAAEAVDIENELIKTYRHSAQDYIGVHDAAEDFASGNVSKHVECTDCHNPHQANGDASPGNPRVSGANRGVKGIDAGGQQLAVSQNLYEICFKCHADNNAISVLPITRDIAQLNSRLEFHPANPSFHPVESAGVNPDVPTLLPPYTTNSIISCTDCHNTDDPNGSEGPHGSSFEYILERNYTTADYTQESAYSYALCYKCHSRNSILRNESFKRHKEHVLDNKTPCAVCRDPHGVSNADGNSTNNSHLINFDLTVVNPDSQGRRYFEDTGRFEGRCFLKCHGKLHEPGEYKP